ncbi:hypothetical protein D9756_005788 [Leucocoprinus leucothites]|uniref:Uncharacterized protein n=1 Tax=Leucocoprinus leucothites TaxID=201217 RepID=A0A8H5FZE8_9AGAR|nr:hypothetical protein D9756_005788 [Leucoagaricus leucothites]
MASQATSHLGVENPPAQQALCRRLFVQLIVFFFLIFGYLTLAAVCLKGPLPWKFSSASATTESCLNAALLTWRTLAIACAQDIAVHGFSSEWYFRLQETGTMIPGHTDRVSTITTGLWDRFTYTFSRKATTRYRLSFITYWVLVALAAVAPAAINLDNTTLFDPAVIRITNFQTTTGAGSLESLGMAAARADVVVELEIREDTLYGLTTEENIIVGWPDLEDVSQLEGDLTFRSDVLLYNMSCWWEAPSFGRSEWNTTVYAGGFSWYPLNSPVTNTFDGGLMPMYRFSVDAEFNSDFPNPLHAVDPVGLSGYLFLGHNETFPRSDSKQEHHYRKQNINLDDLPTVLNSSGFHFIDYYDRDGYFKSPLATFLLCDPQAYIRDGEVLLYQTNSSLRLLSESIPTVNGSSIVGNISPDAANLVLALGLIDALENDDDQAPMRLGALASQVFTNSTPSKHFDTGLLALHEIENNLNRYLKAGAKGYSSPINSGRNEQDFINTSATMARNTQTLVADLNWVICTAGLFLCASITGSINYFYLRVWKIPPFDLENLIWYYEKQKAVYYHKEVQQPGSPGQIPGFAVPPGFKSLALRLLMFTVLEVAFVSMVVACASKPFFLDSLPFTLTLLKGGLTAILVLWQNLATFFLVDAISFAFSSEWSLQIAKDGKLRPGKTDFVSHLNSGIMDQFRFFFTRRPTLTFRIAFLASLTLLSLNHVAPGSITVTKAKFRIPTSLQVADLHLLTSSRARENDNNVEFLQHRTNTLISMESEERITFRYKTEHNWIVAWPNETSIESDIVGDVWYPSDVIFYNYSCGWHIPEEVGTFQDDGETFWLVDGQKWFLWSDPPVNNSDSPLLGGIMPMYRFGIDMQPDPRSAYLVLGTNSSFAIKSTEKERPRINLDHVPTLFHPYLIKLVSSTLDPSFWLAPLSTILVCDPGIVISGGVAQLSQRKNTLRVVTAGLSRIGNMPDDAINAFLTNALLEYLDIDDEPVDQYLGNQTMRVLLESSSRNSTEFPYGIPVRNLSVIGQVMNGLMMSGSKAFLDGIYVDQHNELNLTSHTRIVNGTGEIHREALVSHGSHAVGLLCLIVLSILLFGLLMRFLILPGGDRRVAFTLNYLLPIL